MNTTANQSAEVNTGFTSYQKFIIAILAILQFTIILDFMVLSPLGEKLMKVLTISPKEFGWVVAAYAFSAGASGILAAGFADKYDRKKLLVFFYVGFITGTLFCGIAPDYKFLLCARIVTGIFGGVMSSISFAIITDMFPMQMRGRVMGYVQMAFAASQILGIPIGLYLANKIHWHAPFLMIVGVSVIVLVVIIVKMKPIDAHLKFGTDRNAFEHLMYTLVQPQYILAFVATGLMSVGGFMMMPFGSAFLVNNIGLTEDDLPFIFLVTGICAIITGPLIGKLSDKIGKYKVFIIGSLISLVLVYFYVHMPVSPIWYVMIINSIMFVGITARIISSSALMTAVPDLKERGSFMGINSSIQQMAGGIASVIAGSIVVQKSKTSPLEEFDTVGYVVMMVIIVCIVTMYFVNRNVAKKIAVQPAVAKPIV